MRRTLITFFSLALAVVSWSTADACSKTNPLFEIGRNKNGNVVHYDACLTQDNHLSDSEHFLVYWALENGKREDLNGVEKRYAYGIESERGIAKDKAEIVIAALKGRKMTVEKIDGAFRAVFFINGEKSLLERVYVQAEDKSLGLPKVVYVDVFGRTLKGNKAVNERITPKS